MARNAKRDESTEPATTEVTQVVEPVETPKATIFSATVHKGCKNGLNLRKEPSLTSEVICVLMASSKIKVVEEESTEKFYKVKAKGKSGYCMKQFVEVEK